MDDEDLDLSAQLSAWTAPPAPLNLADRVIARAAATDEAIKVVTQHRRMERRWWIGGALAAVMLGAAIAIFIVPRDTPVDSDASSGTLATTRPQQLTLPGAIATLGPGAVVSWQTNESAVRVQHHGGSVTWRVGDRPLSVDVGAVSASIEASNATLRVETVMNLSDARVVGAAALTSAAVALVTVAVYEGHAKLTSAGQSVVVVPGTIYEVIPGQRPVVHHDVVTMTVGGTPPPAPEHPPAPVSERTATRSAPKNGLTVEAFEAVMKPLAPTLAPCVKKFRGGQDVAIQIAADGHVAEILSTDSDANADACLRKVLRNAVFPNAKAPSRFTSHVEAPCNFDDLLNEGIAATARGDNATALKSYDAALKCKYDPHALALAFMGACRVPDLKAARRYWKGMNADMKTHYLQMCLHEHITQDMLDE